MYVCVCMVPRGDQPSPALPPRTPGKCVPLLNYFSQALTKGMFAQRQRLDSYHIHWHRRRDLTIVAFLFLLLLRLAHTNNNTSGPSLLFLFFCPDGVWAKAKSCSLLSICRHALGQRESSQASLYHLPNVLLLIQLLLVVFFFFFVVVWEKTLYKNQFKLNLNS